jgi:hypothetical protein
MWYNVTTVYNNLIFDTLPAAKLQAAWARSAGYAAEITDMDGNVIEPLQLGCD